MYLVCANTLIPLGEATNQLTGSTTGSSVIVDEVKKIRHAYFNASREEKKELETKFIQQQKNIGGLSLEWDTDKKNHDYYDRLSKFNPFKNESCPWFDTWWMFGLKPEASIIKHISVEIDNLNEQIKAMNKQIVVLNHSLKNNLNLSIIALQFINTDNQINTIKTEINIVQKNLDKLSGQIEPQIDQVVWEKNDFSYAINSLNNRIQQLNTQIMKLNQNLQKNIEINGCFDIVIGNPPYVNVEKIDTYIKENIKHYKTAHKKYDLYVLFYELGINNLKPDGVLSYITSNKFLSQEYGTELRKLFLKYTINEIINFNYDLFNNATVRTCIVNMRKSNAPKNHKIKIVDVNSIHDAQKFYNNEYSLIHQSVFETTEENNFRINLNDEKIKILNLIQQDTIKVEDICSVNYGLRPSSEKLNLKKESFIYSENSNNKYKKYFEGKDMGYWLIARNSYIDYKPEVMYNAMFRELFEMPKLVGLRTLSDIDKLRFIYDNEGYYCNDAVVILSLWFQFETVEFTTVKRLINKNKIGVSKQYAYQYVHSILNSKLIKFYVNELFYDGTHFYPNQMKSLPIKRTTIEQQAPFVTLVNYMLHLHNKENSAILPNFANTLVASQIEELLNMMVYELYFEDHLKSVGLDVLSLISDVLSIINKKYGNQLSTLPLAIRHFYEWYQQPDNLVRQRISLIDSNSPNILSVINASLTNNQ
ncbi:MAG: TaqI-like C-terminal specificity domain-containing protein [Phycisphaerales bacterium]|nr:TaqI-like C-terminal specificity domain-containing protein [Phycisphaerales bacterium]